MSLKSVISAGTIAAILTIVTLAVPTSANAGPITDQVSATVVLGTGSVGLQHECGFCGLGD